MSFFIQHCWMIPLAPLVGFTINGLSVFSGKKLPRNLASFIACAAIFTSFVFAAGIFWELIHMPAEARNVTRELYPWLVIGNVKANVAFLIDPLSSIMMLIITGRSRTMKSEGMISRRIGKRTFTGAFCARSSA